MPNNFFSCLVFTVAGQRSIPLHLKIKKVKRQTFADKGRTTSVDKNYHVGLRIFVNNCSPGERIVLLLLPAHPKR